jgi:hypothetical protein
LRIGSDMTATEVVMAATSRANSRGGRQQAAFYAEPLAFRSTPLVVSISCGR